VTLLTDFPNFLRSHRPHGPMTTDATEPASAARCLGGGLTPGDAELDLPVSHRWTEPRLPAAAL